MKHIYVLRCNYTRKDGVNRVIADLACAFKERLSICVARYVPSEAFEIPQNTQVVALKHRGCNSIFFLGFGVWRFLKLAELLNAEEGDIILCTHGMADILHASIIRILLRNKNVRISAFAYDKSEVIPSAGTDFYQKANLFLTRAAITLLIRSGIVDELLALSSDTLRFFRKVFHTDKVRTIRLGVSCSLVSLSERREGIGSERLSRIVKNDCFRIFFLGILTPERRFEDVLQALKALITNGKSRAHLFVGGALDFAPAYTAAVKLMVRQLALSDHVHFLGVLTDEESAFMYRNCDAFVWPGVQSWGLAPLEAMLFGTPAIVSAGCGVSEVLNERVAIITPLHDPLSIESALATLMQDDEYRNALGLRAQRFVKEGLTFVSTADELMRLWQLN